MPVYRRYFDEIYDDDGEKKNLKGTTVFLMTNDL